MAIPDYQSFLRPLLETINDGKDHHIRDVTNHLATVFHLSPEDLEVTLSSGSQKLFYNRVAWCKTYLKAAGLLEQPKRGIVSITQEGRSLLARELLSNVVDE